jgi:hypothetical protein
MYQFARLLNLRGDARETMAWASEVTGYVNEHSELDVSLWGAVFGYPVGTVVWSTIVEGRAQLAAETDKLTGDDSYLDLVAKAQDWTTTPAEDVFRSLVFGGPGDAPPAVGAVGSVTQAVAATGKFPDAVAWATDMAEYGSGVIGTQISLMVNAYGDFGGMAFISVADDMASADRMAETVRADAGYLERIQASAGLFVDGSARQGLLRRLA